MNDATTFPLSKTQQKILFLIRKHGFARFGPGRREFAWRVMDEGGVFITADQTPEYFMQHKGWLTRDTVSGVVLYKLTEVGRARADEIKASPL